MIYVDVTAACLLPLQSGIPRTTRGVYGLLGGLGLEAKPIFWQPFRGSYTELSARARGLLENPFPTGQGKAVPRDSTLPLLWASFRDLLGPWPRVVRLSQTMRAEDTLLLTTIFPDNRVEYLLRLMTKPGRKVAIFHDAIPLHDKNVVAWEKARHVKALHLLAKMDRVIAVSHAAEKDLQAWWRRHGIAAAPTRVLPWPIPFAGKRPEFSEPPFGKKRILYVSRLKQTKNHLTLFAACEKLWSSGLDFELELIGCEDEAKESQAVVTAMQKLQEGGRPIIWHGHVSEEELHAAYQRATFTVFPSLMEGFGLPVIESFWHGRAVICGNEDAVGELTQGGGCLTVEVRNADRLASAMGKLLGDEAGGLALAREAYARPSRTWADYGRDLKPILENR